MILACLIFVYVVSAVTCYGISLGDYIGEFGNFDRRSAIGNSLLFGLMFGALGPVGIVGAVLMTGFCQHGLKFK